VLIANLLIAICILIAVSRASAAWGPPRWVSAEGWGATDSPTVAVDRQGNALLVWEGAICRRPAVTTRCRRGGGLEPAASARS